MRAIEQAKTENTIPVEKKNMKLWVARSFLFALLMLFCIPSWAMASHERFVLDFNDSHIRSHRGADATIFLKKALKDQYPRVQVSDLKLKKVVLMAKSKRGRGGAGLRVGKWATDMYEVGGGPRSFHGNGKHSFERVKFGNPSHDSKGPWQLGLRGNFIVRKVVLIVDNPRRRDRYDKWDRNRR